MTGRGACDNPRLMTRHLMPSSMLLLAALALALPEAALAQTATQPLPLV